MSDLKRSGNFLDLPPNLAARDNAAAWIIPVPFDATSSWHKGADLGPQAAVNASAALEWYDIETDTSPCERGIFTHPPVFGDTADDPASLARAVRAVATEALDAGALPVVLGGEHSVTIGAVNAAADRHRGLTVLQLDAHGDTRASYSGSDHSHACVMARARERAAIAQVGIRSIAAEEAETIDRARVVWAHEIAAAEADPAAGRSVWVERVLSMVGSGPVYVTVDLDVFDAGVMPATGTPEPGGLDWWQVTGLLAAVSRNARIVGLDVVELCPTPGAHGAAFLAAKLAYRGVALALATPNGAAR